MGRQNKCVLGQVNQGTGQIIIKSLLTCVPYFYPTLIRFRLIDVTRYCCYGIATGDRPSYSITNWLLELEWFALSSQRKDLFLNEFGLYRTTGISEFDFFCFATASDFIYREQKTRFITQIERFFFFGSPLVNIQIPQVYRTVHASRHQNYSYVWDTLLRRKFAKLNCGLSGQFKLAQKFAKFPFWTLFLQQVVIDSPHLELTWARASHH